MNIDDFPFAAGAFWAREFATPTELARVRAIVGDPSWASPGCPSAYGFAGDVLSIVDPRAEKDREAQEAFWLEWAGRPFPPASFVREFFEGAAKADGGPLTQAEAILSGPRPRRSTR